MTALIVGTVLAVAALAFVLLPLFRDDVAAGAMSRRPPSVDRSEGDRERAVDALREIEFDRETGKLSDADYTALKASYTQRALVAMRAESELAPPHAADIDPVEMAVRRYRARRTACPDCGPRPEPDAAYCSTCGLYLEGACAHCGAEVEARGARYCGSCGHTLAA